MQRYVKLALAGGAAAAVAALFSIWLAPVVFLAVFVTGSSLVRDRRIWFVGDTETAISMLMRRREEALRAMKDLEDDRNCGKLSAEDLAKLRPRYLKAAKELTRELDAAREKQAEARKRVDRQLKRDAV